MCVFGECCLWLLLSTEPEFLNESGLKSSKVFGVLQPNKKLRNNRLM